MRIIGEKMKISKNEHWVLLGASSGLGRSFLEWGTQNHPEILFTSISRKTDPSFDFSKSDSWETLVQHLSKIQPTRVFYFAGGGPYGAFREKAWKDHEWAWRVSFFCPAYLLHHLQDSVLKQWVFVGSAIAESSPDPFAVSYASAKHALVGLLSSLWREGTIPGCDIRLFSPGYMDTRMLPPGAKIRQTPDQIQDPKIVAQDLGRWIQDVRGANTHWRLLNG